MKEQIYKLGQEVFYLDQSFKVRSFRVGAICGDDRICYAAETHFDHKWTSQELLYPNAEEAVKNAIQILKDQLIIPSYDPKPRT